LRIIGGAGKLWSTHSPQLWDVHENMNISGRQSS
jgi:hypothetical protein